MENLFPFPAFLLAERDFAILTSNVPARRPCIFPFPLEHGYGIPQPPNLIRPSYFGSRAGAELESLNVSGLFRSPILSAYTTNEGVLFLYMTHEMPGHD
jgi:hypothetical protein